MQRVEPTPRASGMTIPRVNASGPRQQRQGRVCGRRKIFRSWCGDRAISELRDPTRAWYLSKPSLIERKIACFRPAPRRVACCVEISYVRLRDVPVIDIRRMFSRPALGSLISRESSWCYLKAFEEALHYLDATGKNSQHKAVTSNLLISRSDAHVSALKIEKKRVWNVRLIERRDISLLCNVEARLFRCAGRCENPCETIAF